VKPFLKSLLKQKIKKCFQLKFVGYRNYNSNENDILEVSPWENNPNNLRMYLEKLEAKKGWGNEAIEIGLKYANDESEIDPITQIILIGDSPSNTEEEVIGKRSDLRFGGEKYWNETKYGEITHYKKELARLKTNNIPVHAFYLKNEAKENFQEIANETTGRCDFLDSNSPNNLTNLLVEQILRKFADEKIDEYIKTHNIAN